MLKPVVDLLITNGIYSMIVKVLEENHSRYFYESLGAQRLDTLEIKIAGETYRELVYGWEDIRELSKYLVVLSN